MKRLLLYLFIVLYIFTGCNKQKQDFLFPISIDDLNYKITNQEWSVETLNEYSKSRTNFKLKNKNEITLLMETIGSQEERSILISFFYEDRD